MSALATIALFVLVGLWASASYARLLRLRRAVRRRWRDVGAARRRREDLDHQPIAPDGARNERGEADHALEQARLHYNLAAAKYNEAIVGVPGNILAGLAGFRRAELMAEAVKVDS
jgi:hypothetical protein